MSRKSSKYEVSSVFTTGEGTVSDLTGGFNKYEDAVRYFYKMIMEAQYDPDTVVVWRQSD